jgi:hypothetical protein
MIARAILLSSSGALVAGARQWTLDSLMATVIDPQITMGGDSIAYVVRSVNRSRNAYDSAIRIAPAAGGPPIELSALERSRAPLVDDGRTLAFPSARDGETLG